MFRIARWYGKWPHEVAALPFHYYLALREDWIKLHTVTPAEEEDARGGGEDTVDFNAESFTGSMV